MNLELEKLKSVLAAGGAFLGDLLFWTLEDAEIDRPSLVQSWKSEGLSEELLPDPPTPERALKLAVREAQVGQSERLIRLGREDEASIIFAIVREHREPDGSVSYNQEAKVTLDRAAKLLTADDSSHDIVQAIQDGYRKHLDVHVPDDVRRSITKALHSFAAVTLRDHGGVYWVAHPYAAQVRQLQRAIERIGRSRFYLLPVHESAESSRSLSEAAQGALEQELAHLEQEIEGFLATPPDRVSTLTRRFDAFEELSKRAVLYRDVLDVHVSDLDEKLKKMSASVKQLLQAKQAA